MKISIILLAVLPASFSLAAETGDATPWIYDSFESGDFSTSSLQGTGNLRWSPSNVKVSDFYARTGSYSARFVFGPNADGEDSWRELGFRFETALSEVWIEYWILYPDNYYHRSQSGSSNNKFFQLNYNGAPKQMLTVESAVQGGGNSMMRRFLSTTQNPDGSNNWTVNDRDTPDFIGGSDKFAIELGQWTKVSIHYKAGSDGRSNDGVAEISINGNLFHSYNWPFWEPDNQGRINGGYILGWSNSGYTQSTSIYVDDFKVYRSQPGSSDSAAPEPPTDFRIEN